MRQVERMIDDDWRRYSISSCARSRHHILS